MLVGHLYVSFGSYLFQIGELFSSSAHFLIEMRGGLLLSFMICLYILEINPLLVALFANIFFQFCMLFFFILFIVICCTKLVSLIKDPCSLTCGI